MTPGPAVEPGPTRAPPRADDAAEVAARAPAGGSPGVLGLQNLQGAVGNDQVSRHLAASHAGGVPVQRGFWGMDRPPAMPAPSPDLTLKLRQWKDPTWAAFQLRASWTRGGREAADQFRTGLVLEAKPAGPDEQKAVQAVLDAEITAIETEERSTVTAFATAAHGVIGGMLTTSATAIDAEMKRYGFAEETSDGAGTGAATLDPTKEYAALATAAKEITDHGQKMVAKQAELTAKYGKAHQGGPMEEASNREATQRDVLMDPAYVEIVQAYETLYSKHSREHPILAAYRNAPLDVNAIAQGQRSPAGKAAAAKAGATLVKKKHDITETRDNVASGKLSIYGLPNVMAAAKQQQGATPGSLKARFVDDKAAQVKADKAAVDMAIGAIGAAALIVATVATAGGAALVAAGATGVGLGISGAQLYEHLDQFSVATSAANTDLDRAKAIAQTDPSLFWLALDIAMFVGDLVQAGQVFRQLAGPVRKLMSLRQAATGAGPAAEQEAARITEVFEKEVRPAADALPGPARTKVLDAVDPKNVASSVVKAAGKGTWKWKEIEALLKRTKDGQEVLALVDKYKITIAQGRGGASYYSHEAKTIFISEVAVGEDAMNTLVHEIEHADWRMTGKSAMGVMDSVPKEEFIQRMCREEAAAEARTIRNKYQLQTLLNKKVLNAPTEEFYHQAFVANAQGLAGSTLSEAERVAIAGRKAENALAEAFFHKKVATSVDGADYVTYYGAMWEKGQAPATVRTGPPTF